MWHCLHPQVGKLCNTIGRKVNGVRVNLTTLFNILCNLEFGWQVKLAVSLDCMLGVISRDVCIEPVL